MKKTTKMRLAVAAMAMIAGTAGAAGAVEVVPPAQNAVGMTAGDWSAAWWQYVLQIPLETNPAADSNGANCGVDQTAGPVFFLTGNFTGSTAVTRYCSVPIGRTLVIPLVNAECSTLEPPPFYGANEKELRSCAASTIDAVDTASLQLTVDGVSVPALYKYRAQSPVFTFHVPAKNILGLKTGKKVGLSGTSGSAVSDGYWVLLKPLPPRPEPYTINFKGTIGAGSSAFTIDVTYVLSIQQSAKLGTPRAQLAETKPAR